jgi:hypothetical protein
MQDAQRMFESGMCGTRENIVQKGQLADPPQSLEEGMSDDGIFEFCNIDAAMQIVSNPANQIKAHSQLSLASGGVEAALNIGQKFNSS